RLHQAIAGEKGGGVGPGISPKTALSLGLKVDMDALPADLVAQIKAGKVDLDDPATTTALLSLNAVVGVTGVFPQQGKTLGSVGINCAICHSTVDDAFLPGIGRSEEHTSELQSPYDLACRLLLAEKNSTTYHV